jgi:endonuclease YncB( thermonuclease family)
MVFGPYPGVVTALHDGDTMRINLDLGFGVHQTDLSCRVFGINAPELATAAGKVAREFALTLVKPGDSVRVVSHGWDKYGGRFDGAVTLTDGRDFGEQMVLSGNAVVM